MFIHVFYYIYRTVNRFKQAIEGEHEDKGFPIWKSELKHKLNRLIHLIDKQ